MKSTPQNNAHIQKKNFSSFSRKQVNQVNHQKRTYYIPGKYLEQGNSLKANTVWKMWPREIKSTFRNDTHLKKIELSITAWKQTLSTPSRDAHIQIFFVSDLMLVN